MEYFHLVLTTTKTNNIQPNNENLIIPPTTSKYKESTLNFDKINGRGKFT